MPDHAALIIHPGSSDTDPDLYDKIPLCDLLAAEIISLVAASPCLPLDLFCYLACATITSNAATMAKAACEAGIDPDEMGYEKMVLEFYQTPLRPSQYRRLGNPDRLGTPPELQRLLPGGGGAGHG